jgi:glycosyltransferase involved in cell wall biosynthesis
MFEAEGLRARHLPMPEYYGEKAALAAEWGPIGDRPVHLIFRSTEDIRLLKPGYNIACFAWEFDVLKNQTLVSEHPFLNQRRMLGICDEIWVPSQYTKCVLELHGLGNVHRIPAPITMPAPHRPDRHDLMAQLAALSVCPLFVNFLAPRDVNRAVCEARTTVLGEWLARRMAQHDKLRIYLTVLNPEDFRKDLDTMLRGFYYFAAENPGNVLLVKALTARSRFALADVVADVVRNKMAAGTNIECDDIVFFNDFLDDEGLSSLYWLADFYLCTSVAEGQNLPLLEAMAHGVVPVTTLHTAMLDYIDAGNAVLIPHRRVPNDCMHFAACAAGKPFAIDRCGYIDVHDALVRSARLPVRRRWRMAAHCQDKVRAAYAYAAVWPLVLSRLQSLSEA